MAVRQETRVVHGYRRAFLQAGPRLGTAPVLLLVHGVGDSSRTWRAVLPLLAQNYTVIAPDLLGHGDSDKPRADYSIGGFANGMRDLLTLLGVERVTLVGHSLGGGVALQFAYQYPGVVERLILVASGGLGAEVSPLLRIAALPGASVAIAVSVRPVVRLPVVTAARLAARLHVFNSTDVEDAAQIWGGLRDGSTRRAFLRTLRGVVDVRGQTVTSRDRLYLTAAIPTLVVWGERDHVLPVHHARAVVEALPGAHLALVPGAGHLPHCSHPVLVAALMTAFLDATQPAQHDAPAWRALLAAGEATSQDTSPTTRLGPS